MSWSGFESFALPPVGLWVELQLVYTGALQMTLQTKFNLSKLGKEGGQDMDCTTENANPRSVLHTRYTHTENSRSTKQCDIPKQEHEPIVKT